MLNDAKVASVRFLNDKVLATRINQEKKFEAYYQVPLKYTIYLPDLFPIQRPDDGFCWRLLPLLIIWKTESLNKIKLKTIDFTNNQYLRYERITLKCPPFLSYLREKNHIKSQCLYCNLSKQYAKIRN